MKQILLFDNYDSFTFNLKHYLEALDLEVTVVRNDEEIINLFHFDGIVLSPGPGLPQDAGRLKELISLVRSRIPVLGVCLGMQAIAEEYGWELFNQEVVKHGVSEEIEVRDGVLFKNISSKINVGLYHSWAVKRMNDELKITATSKKGTVMAVENIPDKMFGVQFHPESILSPKGKEILSNFIDVL